MKDYSNCKTLNDIARQEFGKANYHNRNKSKKLLEKEGINWKDWLEHKKEKPVKCCLYCGKELPRKSYNKFCNRSCAAKYNNSQRKITQEARKKISETLQKRNPNFNGEIKPLPPKNDKTCAFCGKKLKNKQHKFCSNKCQQKAKLKHYIEKWKTGKENGLKGEYGISNYIRKYLLEKCKYKCEKCGWGEKNIYTNNIPLQIHHIDGDYTNNKEENLQVLCPNCHSLTETYGSHNKNGRKGRKKYY